MSIEGSRPAAQKEVLFEGIRDIFSNLVRVCFSVVKSLCSITQNKLKSIFIIVNSNKTERTFSPKPPDKTF